jgi:hypothetical protein
MFYAPAPSGNPFPEARCTLGTRWRAEMSGPLTLRLVFPVGETSLVGRRSSRGENLFNHGTDGPTLKQRVCRWSGTKLQLTAQHRSAIGKVWYQ